MAARTPGQRRRAIPGRVGTSTVSYQELGVAPTWFEQGAHIRGAGQGRGGADPSAGRDEISFAVGPGQRRTRTQASCGTGRAAGFGSTDGTPVCRVPRCRCSRTHAAVQFAPGISTNGGTSRACGRRTVHWRRSVGLGSRGHCWTVWTSLSSSVRGNLHRGNLHGARADRDGDGSGTWVICDARAETLTEANP